MRRIFKAIRRLWMFAFCDHGNMVRSLESPDSTELRFCRGCGRILSCMNENDRTHNKHLFFPLLDFTPSERTEILRKQRGD